MAGRPLTPEEAALWARVVAGVRPSRKAVPVEARRPVTLAPRAALPASPLKLAPTVPVRVSRPSPPPPQNTLDGGWDKRLTRGLVSPDRSIDLHGHTLGSAHALLDHALDQSIRAGDRVVLLVTGKPPRPESERPHARGAIRAAIGDWLAGSRHAGAIAAVRNAHPRHGGAGALYIILRRPREGR